MQELQVWELPSAKTITIALTDELGQPVNLADHTVLQITSMVNKVEGKQFSLSGDEFGDEDILAVAEEPTQCTISFTKEESDEQIMGVFELNIYKERGVVKERETIQAYIVTRPAYK